MKSSKRGDSAQARVAVPAKGSVVKVIHTGRTHGRNFLSPRSGLSHQRFLP
ncbi:MAG: hypothetical protein [Siphoviridae sp. ctpQM7]|nr:MAG: hypothetical protein [Siphoviridae sp. ctpQM7]